MYTHKSKWDSLSLKDKSEMMRAAVQSGIYSLDAIKQVYNEYPEGGPKNQPYTPFLNETPMQAAIRQLQSPEAQAAYWNATHPQTTNETPIIAQSDGTFRRETRNIPLNTAGEAAKTALEFTPVVGDVLYAGDVADEARQGNYGTAAAMAGLAVLPNVVEKPLKKGLRKIGLFDNATTAAKSTPAEWTAAQDAAIARGDIAEAQRLRDLHNEVATKNTSFKDVGYRGIRHDTSESPFYFTASGDTGPAVASTYMREEGTYTPYTRLWSRTKQLEGREKQLDFLRKNNALSTEQEQLLKKAIEDDKRAINEAKEAIKDFSDPLFQKLYISAENPTIIDAQRSWWNSIPMRDVNNKKYYTTTDKLALENKNKGKDVLVINNVKDSGKLSIHDPNFNPGTDIVVLDSKRAKLADAVTYDDNGTRIPLGERDNSNVDDIRYIWPTVLLGGTAAASYANQQGLGGPLVQLANKYDGYSQPTQPMYTIKPDALYVKTPDVIKPIYPEMSELGALERANQVYSNYDRAKDSPITGFNLWQRNVRRYLKDNVWDKIPAGISNCTLTATQWVDPTNFVKSAASIVSNPEKYRYTQINEDEAIPGNLIIAKDPEKESYHTMMIEGFTDKEGSYEFNGKSYKYKKGEPLVRYSRGGHDNSFLRSGVPLSVYTANSDGHTKNYFYRYNYPNSVLLDKIIVTPNK